MDTLHLLLDYFLHLDKYLNQAVAALGPWFYGLLFTIVFCETGLVVTPFLPGDSLLFAVGALAASDGSPISLGVAIGLLIVAAILGDAVNYAVGKRIGSAIFRREDSRWLNRKHLDHAQRFYEKYGAKTIVIARFVPIVRTFAPFVAGIGKMSYRRFAVYNIAGGIAWVLLFTLAGYFFGDLPWVKSNFHYVILAILVLSVLPAIVEVWRSRRGLK
ncbi:MAG TPA: DedA family protein [Thermoanaerobaculia bacterium]|jgi:membrane-associated protein|nr:DedA family protein [Thermoanaerobaculia bacterium]